MTLPGPAGQLVKLLPVAFVPSLHFRKSSPFLDAKEVHQGSLVQRAESNLPHKVKCELYSL